jgi:hypothetical protein
MSKLISRWGGSRYIYDEDGHVEQVDEINAKMTNISLQTWPDFESAPNGCLSIASSNGAKQNKIIPEDYPPRRVIAGGASKGKLPCDVHPRRSTICGYASTTAPQT